MKKFISLIVLIIFAMGTQAQTIRWYPKTKYCVKLEGERSYKDASIGLAWLNNDASNLDNLYYISYPNGHVSVLTLPKYDGKTSDGYSSFIFRGEDEGNRNVNCYIVKVNENELFFSIHYSDNLNFSFYINLLEFYTNKD
jgi:hypothetical protein